MKPSKPLQFITDDLTAAMWEIRLWNSSKPQRDDPKFLSCQENPSDCRWSSGSIRFSGPFWKTNSLAEVWPDSKVSRVYVGHPALDLGSSVTVRAKSQQHRKTVVMNPTPTGLENPIFIPLCRTSGTRTFLAQRRPMRYYVGKLQCHRLGGV